MDHLPRLVHAVGPYPRVPFLCNEEYDKLPFDGYQDRRGWTVQRLYNRDFTQHPPHETASFLQTWLFFGALNEILGFQKPIDLHAFVQEDGIGRRICTTHLNVHLAAWAEQMESLATRSAEECRAALGKIGTYLNTIHKLCGSLSTSPNSPLPPEVILSFAVLGCTIDHALKWFWGLGRGRNWDLNTLAATRMMHFGWCPRDIAVARSFLSEVPMFCASYMARPSAPQDHWQCSEMTCAANQIDERVYVTKHRVPGCQCGHMQPMQDDIRRILDQGQVPVVQLTPRSQPDGSRTFDFKVKAGGAFAHYYIAISHVWSDGLGNPHQNSLPFCQLEYLYDLLVDTIWDEVYTAMQTAGEDIGYDSELEKKILDGTWRVFRVITPATKRVVTRVREFRGKPLSIWIDTLCVPLEKRYRKMAIGGMQDVYAKAMYTLVLDSELQSLQYRITSPEELLVRVGLSGWMRRAWTFQEGVLANMRVRILFADGLSKLPLGPEDDDIQTGEHEYVFPRFMLAMQKFEAKIADWSDRHNIERPPINQVPKSRLEEQAQSRKTFSLPRYMLEDAKNFFSDMKTVWYRTSGYMKPSDQVNRMIAAWEGLRWRATSREEDKFICFAGICAAGHKDRAMIQKLLANPPEQRMQAWILTRAVIPTGFLFLGGPRYKDKGFRWAPMGVWRETLEDKSYAVRDPATNELLFRKPGFVLDATGSHLSDTFLISDQDTSLRYLVSLDRASMPAEAGPTTLQNHGTLGIVMMQMVGQRQPEYDLYKEAGVLLGNVHQAEDRIYGDFLCRVEVQLFTDEQSKFPIMLARPMADDQAWVIS